MFEVGSLICELEMVSLTERKSYIIRYVIYYTFKISNPNPELSILFQRANPASDHCQFRYLMQFKLMRL